MEDRNILVSDCIVICCCCQCMILQILVFILLKLPSKAMKKTKQYTKKLRTSRKKRNKIMQKEFMRRYEEDSLVSRVSSLRLEIEDFFLKESLGLGCCEEQVERVMEDLSKKGLFGFGSFWGGDEASRRSLRTCVEEEMELDYGVVQCHLIELFGSVEFYRRY